jgi:hypothetical protein
MEHHIRSEKHLRSEMFFWSVGVALSSFYVVMGLDIRQEVGGMLD